MKRRTFLSLLPSTAGIGLSSCRHKADPNVVRFGHFPNVTHVQGLVAHQLSRRGEGWFEKRLGVKIEWFTYNAGPSATEAIFSGALDVTYIGPSPVLNAYAKSNGEEMRVIAGAAKGGNSLVIHADSSISKPEDFHGKKIATPQLGNTQDVQTRAWLAQNGIKTTLTGGEANVLPTENANQFALFQGRQIDAVWTVEPWVTRLELDGGGKIFLEDKETSVTLLVASAAMVNERAGLTKKLLGAHKELTKWIQEHPAESRELVKAELTALMKTAPRDELLERALGRVILTDDISRDSLQRMVANAKSAGFLKGIPDLSRLLPTL